ncbi:hypothetical protein BDR22DRAFT_835555 [Usnea florida]
MLRNHSQNTKPTPPHYWFSLSTMDVTDMNRALVDGRCVSLQGLRPETKAVQVLSFLDQLHLDM